MADSDTWYCETCNYEFSEWQREYNEDEEKDCCPKCGNTDIHKLEGVE